MVCELLAQYQQTEHKKDHELEDLAGCTNQQICVGNTLLTIFSNSCVGFFCVAAPQSKSCIDPSAQTREGWMNVLAFGGLAARQFLIGASLVN